MASPENFPDTVRKNSPFENGCIYLTFGTLDIEKYAEMMGSEVYPALVTQGVDVATTVASDHTGESGYYFLYAPIDNEEAVGYMSRFLMEQGWATEQEIHKALGPMDSLKSVVSEQATQLGK